MSDIDFEHISNLFTIISATVQHSGKFGSIQTEAFNELGAINAELRKKQMDRKAADERAAQADATRTAHDARVADHTERQPALEPVGDPGPAVGPLGAPDSEVADPQAPTLADRRL